MDGVRSALIVASYEYSDQGLQQLRAPAIDAKALAAVLGDPEIGDFKVQTLLNRPAHEVNLAVEDFFADRSPDDLLLVHFSCHGIKDEDGELYFAASNTLLGRLGATAVAAEFVNRQMSRSRSRRIVLLLDCCYAGAFERGMTARAGTEMAIRDHLGGRGRAVITASSAMEYAFEGGDLTDAGEPAPSVFTSALVKGLESGEADRNEDGLVALDELYDYVYDKVRLATPNQTPGKWTYGAEGELIIARRSGPLTTPAARTKLRTALAGDWAICCSGGGVRSAAFCLGALQSLEEGGLLAKVKWILGVSGGSYIAASRALVASNLPARAQPPAYAPGTPEERNLRDSMGSITPDATTGLGGALSLLLGAMVTFIVAAAPVYAVAYAWGWLLRWQGVLVPGSKPHVLVAQVTAVGWWLPSVIAGGIFLALFAFWWLTLEPTVHRRRRVHWWMSLKPDDRGGGVGRAQLVMNWAAALTVGLALAMLAAPPAIAWLTHSTGSLGTIAHFVGFGARPSWLLPALAGVIAAVTVVARFCQAGLARWNAPGGPAVAQPGLLIQLGGWLRQNLLPWLASAVIVLGGVVLALLWTAGGSAGFTAGGLAQVIIALVITVLARVAVNVNRLSMHDLYRRRLADAFATTRPAAQEQDPLRARRLFAEAAAAHLSGLSRMPGADGQPGLVICGTANINAAREARPGRRGFCLTFDPEHVTLAREKGLAVDRAQALTSDYEALVGDRRCTLFDVSAISGVAVSPLMGAATRQAYRLLFTATSVRLGVWLPHPNVVRDARKVLDLADRPGQADHSGQAEARTGPWWARRPLLLLCWYLLPHLLWDRKPDQNSDREARLWAHVLQRRLRGGLAGKLWYRAMQPTLGLLWAEAAGHQSYRDTWMYVTDGGHYDNLGLVEALRRGAGHIVVLDASGDKSHSWSTLGSAINLARADIGVEIRLDPTTMVSGGLHLAPGQVVRPWAYGTFTRPQEMKGLPREGEIWVCKLGWWTGAPWDVLAYAKSHSTYPTDSTLEKLYDAAEFAAYQQLGAAAVLDAANRSVPPLRWVSESRR